MPLTEHKPLSFFDELPDDAHAERLDKAAAVRDRLQMAMALMTKRQRLAVRLHFCEGKTQCEVADEMHITQGRVSQLIQEAFTRVRAKLIKF